MVGIVKDSLQPLPSANLIAKPQQSNAKITFAIANTKGAYQLKLQQSTSYEITISYLGYHPQTITLATQKQNLTKDFILHPSTSKLDEVVLNYKIPIVVKEDTITYNVEAFASGKERKLREVLKKLPGVEVDREGNVSVQGKKVTKVLVENKPFFTGDSKLAVNNIPANAVDQVEVLDNYSEIALLKGLQDNDEMAMNLKLKEDKKKFAFGDLEVGGGAEERYLVHPTLFYYSPKTNINIIGDLNNVGIKSFTFKDYLDFEGGISSMLGDIGTYFRSNNDEFSRFLVNTDYRERTNRFGAFNIQQSLNDHTDLSAYAIASETDTETLTLTQNQYINTEGTLIEDRSNDGFFKNRFLLGKATLDYEPSFKEDLKFSSTAKLSEAQSDGRIDTQSPFRESNIYTLSNIKGVSLKNRLQYSKKFDRNHTATLLANFNIDRSEPDTNWITDQDILTGLIPLIDTPITDIFQERTLKNTRFDVLLKHYWVIDRFDHLYTSIGFNLQFNELFSRDVQRLNTGTNDFTPNGFGNDFQYDIRDTYLGMEYKFQRGKFIFKPGIFYHYFSWDTQQLEDSNTNAKALWLPQFSTKVEIGSSERVNFRYRLQARFPTVDRLANRNSLRSFNRVFAGDVNLENELFHALSLSYYKFNLFDNLLLNGSINYRRKEESIKNATQLEGIDQVATVILIDDAEQSLSFKGSISKKIGDIKYSVQGGQGYSDFFQLVNDEQRKNISRNTSSTLKIKTYFDKWPSLELGYTKEFNDYQTTTSTNTFTNDRFDINLEYDFFKDFSLLADYSFSDYDNKTAGIQNTFDIANASLRYQEEDSIWSFELEGRNLFNTSFKQQNSFSDFIIADQQTFILPRMLLFKLSYKL